MQSLVVASLTLVLAVLTAPQMGQCRRHPDLFGRDCGHRLALGAGNLRPLTAEIPDDASAGRERRRKRMSTQLSGEKTAEARPLRLSDGAKAERPARWRWWLLWLLLAVLFTPSIRLPGGVPFRVEDVLVFGAGAILAARYLLGLRTAKPGAIFYYTVAAVGTILMSTLTAPAGLEVTAKEYLDCLRPVKFFLVYWVVRDCNPAISLPKFVRVMSIAAFALLGIACVEMFFARTMPESIVVRFFSGFTEKSPDLLLDMMATRPFATFNTPPDLGYVACVCLFSGTLIQSRWRRRIVVMTFFLILLVTATRMLLFSLPLLMILQAFVRGKTAKEIFNLLRFNLALITLAGASSVVLLPLISPHASEFTQSMIVAVAKGDTGDEYSITTRLSNLYLVDYTWSNAPALGVGSRSLLPDFVDSELILTFHRYGLLGLATLLLIYPVGVGLARQVAGVNRELYQFAVMALATTFLVGITLGALDNSRTGVLLFVILGLVGATKDHQLRDTEFSKS